MKEVSSSKRQKVEEDGNDGESLRSSAYTSPTKKEDVSNKTNLNSTQKQNGVQSTQSLKQQDDTYD